VKAMFSSRSHQRSSLRDVIPVLLPRKPMSTRLTVVTLGVSTVSIDTADGNGSPAGVVRSGSHLPKRSTTPCFVRLHAVEARGEPHRDRGEDEEDDAARAARAAREHLAEPVLAAPQQILEIGRLWATIPRPLATRTAATAAQGPPPPPPPP